MKNYFNHSPVVVGGGIIGLACAQLLSQAGKSITLLEQQAFEDLLLAKKNSPRAYAISPGAAAVLEKSGVWSNLAKANQLSPYRQMIVWDNESQFTLHARDLPMPVLGNIVKEQDLYAAFWDLICKNPAISRLSPCALQTLVKENRQITLKGLSDLGSFQIKTPLLIAADGGQSWVRNQCEIAKTTLSYDHDSLTATIKTSLPHEETAYQYCFEKGILAFLPLSDPYQGSLVWSGPKTMIAQLMSLEDEIWDQTLTQALGKYLGQIQGSSHRIAFPLMMQHVHQYVQPNLALVGDAIHTLHPLAGQGLNLGLLDIGCLTTILEKINQESLLTGCFSSLRQYERQRKPYNTAMVFAMHLFSHWLTGESFEYQKTRFLAFNLTDRLNCLKRFFIAQASGYPYALF